MFSYEHAPRIVSNLFLNSLNGVGALQQQFHQIELFLQSLCLVYLLQTQDILLFIFQVLAIPFDCQSSLSSLSLSLSSKSEEFEDLNFHLYRIA